MSETDTTTEPATEPSETRTFADFGVHAALCDALADAAITTPFPIQELTLPMALAGADVIGQARTGTGKTLAFGLPALQRVDAARREVQAFVIVPTRELCLQVTEDLTKAAARLNLSVEAVFGGRPIEPQAQALAAGAHVVVGTPGRLLDLQQRGMLDLSHVSTLVLDEADEMLDLGFLPDVERLLDFCPTQRQTLLFSATMPSAVVALARRYMDKPTFLRAEDDRSDLSPDTVHHFFSCHRLDKPAVLARILQAPNRGLCVVFTRTKRMADQLAGDLGDRGVEAAPIHSDLRQEARERALRRFRDGKVTVLVATEVAARGLDIDDVTHVVNYDCPDDEKMYLHRIGRTGRAGHAGTAITLAVWNELARLEMIKKALGLGDEPTHEVFSTSDLLDELFDLPERQATKRPTNKASKGDGRKGGTSEGAGAKGGRGGRGRGGGGGGGGGGGKGTRSAQQAADQPAEHAAEEPAAQAVEEQAETSTETASAPVDESAGTGSGGSSRGRRRGGRRRGGRGRSTSGAGEASEASEAGEGTDAGEGSEHPTPAAETDQAPTERDSGRPSGTDATSNGHDRSGTQRTRTRTRTRTRARTGSDGEAPAAGDEQHSEATTTQPASSGGDSDGNGQRDTSRGEQSGNGARSQSRGGSQRGGDKRRGRGGGKRGGKQSNNKSQGDSHRSHPQVTTDVARGEGQPRIRRPLQVQHLP